MNGQRYSKKRKAEIKKKYLAALKKTMGIVTQAAEAVGVSRTTIWQWRKEDPEFSAACEECTEVAIDFAENALMKNIQAGDTQAIKFFLSTKGRNRGYAENTIDGKLTVVRPRVVFEGDENAS